MPIWGSKDVILAIVSFHSAMSGATGEALYGIAGRVMKVRQNRLTGRNVQVKDATPLRSEVI